MTKFFEWLQHQPQYAVVMVLAGFVAGLVKFGGDLLKLIQSLGEFRKPKEQPTLNDVKKVERIEFKSTASDTAKTFAYGGAFGAGSLLAGALLDHAHHAEHVSNGLSAAADLPNEHLASIADAHPVAEHAHGFLEMLANFFESLG